MSIVPMTDESNKKKKMHIDATLKGPWNIILFGSTGSGKSSTANSILQRKEFKTNAISTDIKSTSASQATWENGQIVNVFDTPGLISFEIEADFIVNEIKKCMELAKGSVHALLIVFSLNKGFSKEEEMTLQVLRDIFGPQILDYAIVVFTGLDVLEADDETLDDFLARGFPDPLQKLVDACENRKVFFDNKTTQEDQKGKQLGVLQSYLSMVLEEKKELPFTCRFLQVQEVEQKLRKSQKQFMEQMAKDQHISTPANITEPQLQGMSMDIMDGSLTDNCMASNERTIILFGRSGNGKSSTGNSILGTKAFDIKRKSSDVTRATLLQSVTNKNGQPIHIIDTPGLFEAGIDDSYTYKEIMKCKDLTKNGLHALLLVFSITKRFSEEEEKVFQILKGIFGTSKIINYVIIVFTGLDTLQYDGQTTDDFLNRGFPQPLKEIVVACKHRIAFFDNKTKDEKKKEKQVLELLNIINEVVEINEGKPFSTEFMQEPKLEAKIVPQKPKLKKMFSKFTNEDAMKKMRKNIDREIEYQFVELENRTLKSQLAYIQNEKEIAERRAEEAENELLDNKKHIVEQIFCGITNGIIHTIIPGLRNQGSTDIE